MALPKTLVQDFGQQCKYINYFIYDLIYGNTFKLYIIFDLSFTMINHSQS